MILSKENIFKDGKIIDNNKIITKIRISDLLKLVGEHLSHIPFSSFA